MMTKDKIYGNLKHIEHFEEFSGLLDQQSGHYLLLTMSSDEAATIKTKIGEGTEVTVTDGFCIYLVKNPKTQKTIQITATKEEKSVTKVYDITGLNLL